MFLSRTAQLTFVLLSCSSRPEAVAAPDAVTACLEGCGSPCKISQEPAAPVAVGRLRLRADNNSVTYTAAQGSGGGWQGAQHHMHTAWVHGIQSWVTSHDLNLKGHDNVQPWPT